MTSPFHIRGFYHDQVLDWWVCDGRVTLEPIAGAPTIAEGWILPGLVDAHCHIGLGSQGGVEPEVAEEHARADIASGVTLVRDAGSPINTHWLDERVDMPRIIRAGRHIARTARYIRGFAVEVEPENLVEEVRRQARAGDGWVKLVGDWIDRGLGDLAPLWPSDTARKAINAAHEEGARVTAHCFGEESVYELVRCGIDCIEHGSGLDGSTVEIMAEQKIALVPTLDNWKIFPGIADSAQEKYPTYAAHMRELYRKRIDTITMAFEASVPIYAGTDAGGTRAHGTLLDEILALAQIGGVDFALGAASWRAREWLGRPGLGDGTPADLIVVPENPRENLRTLAEVSLVVIGGHLLRY